ncbi:MAG: Fur family transcriptional regulator [Pleurocapsa sp. MO_226.B13]|nr:Fur family transcriptional regulator [Pleurocapsa sp. MO_226.B13]
MPIRQPSSHKTVFNFLKELGREIDAQDLYLELQRRGKKIGLATVYRALKTLHKQGSIQERMSIKGKSLYSVTSFHQQHHLNCLNCQRSIVIDNCPINSKLDCWFQQSQEFKVYYHTLEFFGLCTDCQEQEAFRQ